MRWKQFKKQMLETGYFNDESRFVLGVDLGSSMSTLAMWSVTHNGPEIIDMSGGYGKPSIPTVLQYIPETKEWVFGEYALLNKGFFHDITITGLPDRLGSKQYVEIDNKPISVMALLSRFIKELLDSCKNINPNCEIAGIVFSVPYYISKESKDELLRSIIMSGFEREFIQFMSDRECVLRYDFFKRSAKKPERVLMLDYGNKEIRGGVYLVEQDEDENMNVTCESSVFDRSLGMHCIDEEIRRMFLKYYCAERKTNPDTLDSTENSNLDSFIYQNKNLIFQNGLEDKPLKLYFNFAYPPFQKTITSRTRHELAEPFVIKFKDFLDMCHNKTLSGKISTDIIDRVICMGGGFEMYWTRDALERLYPESKLSFYRNGGGILALGACIGAASRLSIISDSSIVINDMHRITDEYGIKIRAEGKSKFLPLAERNAFWWQRQKRLVLILDNPTDAQPTIDFFKRNELGEEQKLTTIRVTDLPPRPKGVTRLEIEMVFESLKKLKITLRDRGFGEFYPAVSGAYTYEVKE